jgi:hypothetical protein
MNLIACEVIAHMLPLVLKEKLAHPKNVRFRDLLAICRFCFGEPRINGSHHVFKMPWPGHPRINLQRDGKMAKPYQVKQVIEAVQKWEERQREGFGF